MPSVRSVAAWSLLAFACTLTANEFEPELVAVAPNEPSTPIAGGSPGAGSAAETELCVGGACATPSCTDAESGEPCPVVLCSGPNCSAQPEGNTPPESNAASSEAACDDQALNQNETDLDCGGVCAGTCLLGQRCREDEDCSAGLTCQGESRTCAAPSCQDGVLNGNETSVDCGGGDCPGCGVGVACETGSDCASGRCGRFDECAPATCNDGLQNQDEAGVDCGGACPTPCRSQRCAVDADCTGTSCEPDDCIAGLDLCCQPPRCNDGITNGSETSTDCGGTSRFCDRCPDGVACVQASDCASNSCFDSVCASSCGSGAVDGLETDIDCGGSDAACQRCREGQVCVIDGDCASGACEGGRCCGGSLGDCTRCAERLSSVQDCSAAGPAGEGNCTAFLQCLANNPGVCPTRFAAGCSSDPGVCNHNFFGGDGSVSVLQANAVIIDAGCQL